MSSRIIGSNVVAAANSGPSSAFPTPRTVVASNHCGASIVLWVYRDYENRWCVRREGAKGEDVFMSRERALAFAREIGQAAGSYRLLIELRDGRVTQELLNCAVR
jgi:hypothetical protein